MFKKHNIDVCRALSNNQRVNLIVCLSKPKSVTEMLETCPLSQSALSQHLRILKRKSAC